MRCTYIQPFGCNESIFRQKNGRSRKNIHITYLVELIM